MNAEQFHNALNYLDDDLIGETDELRQGRRMIGRRVIRWVLPAACLALMVGVCSLVMPAMENTDKSAIEFEAGNSGSEFSGYPAMDSQTAESGAETPEKNLTQAVTSDALSLCIPADWTYAVEGEFIVFCPPGEQGTVRVGYEPDFGVCGTGLTTREETIAGMQAQVGTYDGSTVWSFITFRDAAAGYVVINDGADSWLHLHGHTVMEILETMVICN